MDDQNNKPQDISANNANDVVAKAEDSTVTEPQTSEIVEEVKEEEKAAHPFAGLEEPEIEAPKELEAISEPKESAATDGNEAETAVSENSDQPEDQKAEESESAVSGSSDSPDSPNSSESSEEEKPAVPANPNARWYVVHTFAGHENKVATALRQRIEAEHLEHLIYDILVPTQDKIEIKGGKKETVKEKIFPGYILIKMELSDLSWLAVRTTQGVTSFIGAGNKPTPISEAEVASIVKFTTQGASPTFKDVFMVDDTVKIIDGPFAEFIGKVDSVDKEKGRVRVLVSIFGRETPVELDFLQVQKL